MKKKDADNITLVNEFSLSTDICVLTPAPMPGEVHPLASPGLLFFKKAEFKSKKKP